MQNNDKILHQKFVKLGKDRNKLTRELLAMIPEIYKREIYKKEGYATIYEYAGKIAGLSKFVVEKVLRTEKYLQEKPFLKRAILTQGIHKVALVAKIATPENEKIWADKIENMSKSAIQELSKEVRNKPFSEVKCKAVQTQIKIELDEEMQFLFLKLKNRIGKNISNKEAMRQMLLKLTEQEFQKKSTIQKSPGKNLPKVSRYVPVEKKREALTENNGKCKYPGCNSPVEIFHHTDRFATSHSHDSVSGMCKVHHEFAHNGLIQNEKDKFENWQLNINHELTEEIDMLYKKYRQEALRT